MINRSALEEQIKQIESANERPKTPGDTEFEAGVFNDSWIWLGIIIMLAGLILRQPALQAMAACLLAIVPVAWLWNRLSLRWISYERRFDVTRAFPGETVEMTLRMTNAGPLPIPWLRLRDYLPAALPVREVALVAVGKDKTTLDTTWSLRWFDRVTRRYHLHCTRRGHYLIGPSELKSGDAFALFTSRRESLKTEHLVVFPEVFPLSELGLPLSDPFGVSAARERLFEDPQRTRGVRDMQADDSIRHVHWKASARHANLQVRVFDPTADMHLAIFLNVTTMPRHWQGHYPEIFERAVTVAASVAQYAAERSWRVGLFANGVAPHSDQALRVLPSRSPEQLPRILGALASVTSFPSASIEDLLFHESPRVPWGATLAVITGVVTDELRAMLLRLRDAGRRVVLISLGFERPDEIPGVRMYHSGPHVPAFRGRPEPRAVETAEEMLAHVPAPRPRPLPDGWMSVLELMSPADASDEDGRR